MANKPMPEKDALNDEKVEEQKTRNPKGEVVKNEADTNAAITDHGDGKENPKSAAGVDSDDKVAVDVADSMRGPLGHAQDETDGWGGLPVQMRDDADKGDDDKD